METEMTDWHNLCIRLVDSSLTREERVVVFGEIKEAVRQDCIVSAKLPHKELYIFGDTTVEQFKFPKPRRKKETRDAEFNAWYEFYPLKVSVGNAEKAYAKARGISTQEQLMKGVQYYKNTKPDETAYMHPASWLNAKRWLDGQSELPTAPDKSDFPEWKIKIAAEIGEVQCRQWFRDVEFKKVYKRTNDAETDWRTIFTVPNEFIQNRLKTVYAVTLNKLFGQFEVRLK